MAPQPPRPGSAAEQVVISRPWLLLLSFMGGFQIMTLEICGFRVLQLNLGSSVVVTGTLLTTIMVVLSVGYYFGGVLSQAYTTRALLVALTAASVYTHLASVLLLDQIGDLGLWLRDRMWGFDFLEAGMPAAVISVLLYAPPMLAFSMISPFLIRLESAQPEADAGKKSGFFMALSTVGSILGTLIASYALIPFLGARTTAAASNSVVFALLLLVWLDAERRSRRSRRAAFAAGAAGLVLAAFALPIAHGQREQNVVHERDSVYGHIRVVAEKDSRGRDFLAYVPSRVYSHSVVYPSEPLRELVGTLYLAPALIEPPRNMLVLGSAAGGILRHSELLLPNTRITGVDIDPEIHKVAVDVFGVNPQQVTFVSRDARQFVEQDRGLYDFIVVDLFAGEFVPVQCVTRQFFARLKQRLSPGGVIFINTNMNDVPYELPAGANEPFRANRHLESTLREAGYASLFENTYFHALIAYPQRRELATLRARWRELAHDPQLPAAARAALGLMVHTTIDTIARGQRYPAFTDAWAPDMLIERKSNEAALYRALAKAGARPASAMGSVVLSRLLAEREAADSPGLLARAAALVDALEQITVPLTAAELADAGRYLRFGYEEPPALEPRSPWAKLGSAYARMYAAARANDYEALLPVIEQLDALQGELQVARATDTAE